MKALMDKYSTHTNYEKYGTRKPTIKTHIKALHIVKKDPNAENRYLSQLPQSNIV
jgi:hypothetical protein